MPKGKTISENRKASQREAAKKRPQTWKPGQSGNPKGAPKRGESFTEIIKRIGDMTPVEAAARSLELGKQLLNYGDGITLKEAVVLRVYGALLFEPSGSLLNPLMDRAEGKVTQPIEVGWKERAKQNGIDPDKLQSRLVAEFTAAMVSGSGGRSVSDSNGEDTGDE